MSPGTALRQLTDTRPQFVISSSNSYILTNFILDKFTFDCYGNRILTVRASNDLGRELAQADNFLTRALGLRFRLQTRTFHDLNQVYIW